MKSHAFHLLALLPLLLGSALAEPIVDFGASTSKPDPAQAKQLNLPPDTGHVITEVFPDTPAAKLGLAKDDLVLAIDGVPTKHIISLAEVVATNHAPHQEIEVTWSHAGQKSSAKVKLGDGCKRRDFTARYQKNSNRDNWRYATGQLIDYSGRSSTSHQDGHAITLSGSEGGKQKVKVMRVADKKVLFDGEIAKHEMDKISEEVPPQLRKYISEEIEMMTGGHRFIPLMGRLPQGSQQSQQPEQDVNDLLKKLEGNAPANK